MKDCKCAMFKSEGKVSNFWGGITYTEEFAKKFYDKRWKKNFKENDPTTVDNADVTTYYDKQKIRFDDEWPEETVGWQIMICQTVGLDGVRFCPWCGVELKTLLKDENKTKDK